MQKVRAGPSGAGHRSPVIDAQIYFGRRPSMTVLRPVRDAAEIVDLLDRTGIDGAVVAAPDWVDTGGKETPPYSESTKAVFEAAETYPTRLFPMVRLNPNWSEQSLAALKEWAGHPLCRGLRLHPQWEYFPINSRLLVDPLLAICEEHDLPVVFSSGTYPAAQPMIFMDIAGRWPKVKMGLLHGGQRMMHDTIVVAQRCPNLMIICTPRVVPTTLQTFVTALGADRVIFGSELPYEDPRYVLETVRALPALTATDEGLVLGENAARWWQLPAMAAA